MIIGIDASRTTAARPTGTEAYSLELTHALLALDAGHIWRLYFNQPPAPADWPARPELELRLMPFPRLWTHGRLSFEMARRPPDVLFVPAHVLPLVRPRRSVVTVHDLGYHYFPEAHTWSARLYLELSTRLNARWATRVLADSRATADDLMRVYGTPADKLRVVYPGLNPAIRRVADQNRMAEVAGRLGIPGDYILHVGTLQPRKNLARLIEAYGMLAGAEPIPRLVLAGQRGWLSQGIFQAVERLGLAGRVHFPGYVAEEELPALMSGARLFVFPSLYEGFGFPVLEAMACGVPVVCSNTSSLPEVAGEAALLVDPTDVSALAAAMRQALIQTELRARLIDAGQKQAARFSWERAARATLAALEEAAAA